jgi:hypothetical protein
MEEICYEVFGRLTSDHLKEASSEFEENLTDAVENVRCLVRQCASWWPPHPPPAPYRADRRETDWR